jgi:ABC-type transport system involved in multi-copper enzyme maturation permease subunit
MMTQLRLAFRVQRFEIVAMAIAVAVIGVSALIVRSRLDAVAVPAECWPIWFGSTGSASGCREPVTAFLTINEEEGGKVMAVMAFLPLAVGLFLGVPLVGREIEAGTAPTVWALSASRTRWLSGRLLPLLAMTVLLLGALTVAVEILWVARNPWAGTVRFDDAGLHGPVVVAKGVAMLGIAVLAGAVLGRVLPAVIVSTALAIGLLVGGGFALGAWLTSEAPKHVIAIDPGSSADQSLLYVGGTHFSTRWRTPDGELLTDEEALTRVPGEHDPAEYDQAAYDWLYENFEQVMIGVPGSRFPEWSLIETVGFGVIGVGTLLAAFPVINRRRPL